MKNNAYYSARSRWTKQQISNVLTQSTECTGKDMFKLKVKAFNANHTYINSNNTEHPTQTTKREYY